MRRLPPGAHGIPAELVARNQRERLIAAVAEACAEHGYAETSVADLAARAGVSTATFYKRFSSKLECALEAHRELLARLLEEVDRACALAFDRAAKVRAGLKTVLGLFASDPPSARLLTVEVLALGEPGAASHDRAVAAFAARLRGAGRSQPGPDSPPIAGSPAQAGDPEWVLVAGIAALLGKLVIAGQAGELPGLEEQLVALALRCA